MKHYAVYILFPLTTYACRTKPEQAFDLLKQNCRCSKVEMMYTKNDNDSKYDFETRWKSALQFEF